MTLLSRPQSSVRSADRPLPSGQRLWLLVIVAIAAALAVAIGAIWLHYEYERRASQSLTTDTGTQELVRFAKQCYLDTSLAQACEDVSIRHRGLEDAKTQLESELIAAKRQTAELERQRQEDRYRFLLRSGDEWRLNTKLARTRFEGALKTALEAQLDPQKVTERIATLPLPTTIPSDAKLRLLRVSRTLPTLTIDLQVLRNDGRNLAGLGGQDFRLMLANEELRHYAVAPATAALMDHSVAVVLDCSGSMGGPRMVSAKSAIRQLISNLGMSSRARFYTFANAAEARTPWTYDESVLETAISNAVPDGATALRQALSLASRDLTVRATKRTIIVCTDGQDTVGGPTIDEIITTCLTQRIAVDVVGFASTELDQTTLRNLATKTGGKFLLASNPEESIAHIRAINSELAGEFYRVVILDPDKAIRNLSVTVGDCELQIAVP